MLRTHWLVFAAGLALSTAAAAATATAESLDELQRAEHEVAEAALLRDVATDATEVEHLTAARDLLRAADGGLPEKLRTRARRLEFDIDAEIGDAADMLRPRDDLYLDSVRPWPLIDRSALGGLAQEAQQLVQKAQASQAGSASRAAR